MPAPVPLKMPPRVPFEMYDINILELDLEWLDQSSIMGQACAKLSELEADEREAEGLLELRFAKLQQAVRSNPTKHGLDPKNLTETGIKSVVYALPEYRQTWQRHHNAQYATSLQKGVVKTLEQRKTALENLVKLHGQGYFALPRVTDSEAQKTKEWLEMERRRRERRERLARKQT